MSRARIDHVRTAGIFSLDGADFEVVHTGHGPSTPIGEEAPHLQEWVDRGY